MEFSCVGCYAGKRRLLWCTFLLLLKGGKERLESFFAFAAGFQDSSLHFLAPPPHSRRVRCYCMQFCKLLF